MSELTVLVINGEFLVWNAEDVICLRRNHRIIGNCAGSLAWKPRQTVQGSLPLRLSRVEAAFLSKSHVIVLKDASEIDKDNFTSERRSELIESRALQRNAQRVVLQKQKEMELDVLAPTILEGITKKHCGGVETQDENYSTDGVKFMTLKKSELQKTVSNGQLWLDMPISSKSMKNLLCIPNYCFDLSKREQLLLDVFCDLHEQGFYLTNAVKFGGDFLVYPGDPVAYHSFYIAVCIPHDQKLSGLDYSRYGRLANTVRKTLLICSRNIEGDIEYLSISWTGIAQSDEKKA